MAVHHWLAGFLFLLGTGCSTAYIVEWTDEQGAAIQNEKMAVVEKFRSNLADPTKGKSLGPGPESEYEFEVEVPEVLKLQDAIRIATQYNRGFISRRESFFLTMLGLGLTRHNFNDPIFSGSIAWNGSKLEGVALSDTTSMALSGSKLLKTGGSVSVSASATYNQFEGAAGPREHNAFLNGSVSINQPLLRGAGKTVAWEGLTQAERSAVYAARDFELFRQDFAIGIIDRYYSLVSQKKSLRNVERTVEMQEFNLKQARALYRLQRGTQQDVFRAEQAYRDAKNAYLESNQNYAFALDNFKIELGLPLSTEIEIGDEIPPIFDVKLDEDEAVNAALHNRLDLTTSRDQFEDTVRRLKIAKNSLLPDLDLNASVGISSVEINTLLDIGWDSPTGSLGVSLAIPFERRAERNAYRSALISVAQGRRGLREREDRVILEVRDALRRLRQQKQQIENQEQNIETIKRRILRANLDNQAGVGSNRDTVEATVELAQGRNALLDRYVRYYITVLELRQALGILFVDKEGRIVE